MSNYEDKLMFGKVLNDIRCKRGLTFRKMAAILDFCCAYLCDLEKGNRLPTLEVIQRLKEKLNITEEEYLKLSDAYALAHSTIPQDVMQYIIDNELISTIRTLKRVDETGTKTKEFVYTLNKQNKSKNSINL